ncbi:MAG: DUF4105 domain-containing protein [Candidatus Riflebacteria bacterium]|nr:DUF4105 domain-containing protein [Candidatus Riflebacteria bacterium]
MIKKSALLKSFLIIFVLVIASGLQVSAQVNYKLEGIVTVRSAKAKLTTEDGRIFKLVGIDFKDVAAFDDENVIVEGSVKQADQMEELKIKSIVKKPVDEKKVVFPGFKPGQRTMKLVSERDGVFTVGNFRFRQKPGSYTAGLEEHHYRIARIKPDMIDNVYLVLKPFEPKWLAAHSLFLFTFKGKDAITTTKGETTDGMCLTIEAQQRKDQSFSLADGFKNIFGNAWILTSYEDYMEEIIFRKEELHLYPLVMTHDQKKNLVIECLRIGSVNRAGEYYHTITNNCTNNLLLMMNRVLPEEKRIDMWTIPSMVYNLKATTPVAVPKYLMKKSLIEDKMLTITPDIALKGIKRLQL